MAVWPFQPTRARQDAEKLLGAVTLISRQSAFFGEGRAPDTLEGRLEIVTLHSVLALLRLADEAGLGPLSQEFTDVLFRHFDAGLREDGVGDTAVPKRMRRIASSFYGRYEAYAKALAADDDAALAGAIARNVFHSEAPSPFAHALAAYVKRSRAQHAGAPADALFRFDGWASAPA